MAFHHCDLVLERVQGQFYVPGDNVDELKRRLTAHKGVVRESFDFKGSSMPDNVIAEILNPRDSLERKGRRSTLENT